MFNLGLTKKFKKNLHLDNEDREGYLEKKKRLDINQRDLMDDMSLIKLNSTYMEVVDAYYKERGIFTLVYGGCFLCMLIGLVTICSTIYNKPEYNGTSDYVFFSFVSLPILGVCLFGIFKESFIWTHFPIRFNRERKLVHVFHVNGKVKTYEWDKVFFTIKSIYIGYEGRKWYLCAHILAEDSSTILDTFIVSMYASKEIYVKRFWEYVRRYMEEKDGVKEVADISGWFLPIAKRRESFGFGLRTLMLRWGSWFLIIPFSPFIFIQAIARWFSMCTSKIPHWPVEVEEQCVIADNDPYNFDSHSLDMKWHWRYLLTWRIKELTAVTGKKWKV